MLSSPKSTKLFLLLFILLLQTVHAQNTLNLSWTAGSEADLYLYRIFRSTSANASTQIDCVQHPNNTYIDSGFEKGVQYFYRLKSVDFSLNASDYSAELSIAFPKISNLATQYILPPDTTINIQLDPLVSDPDDADDQIIWTITGQNKLAVSITNRVATIVTPANWGGTESLTFKAADDQDFYDSKVVVVRSKNGSSNSAPVFATIPNQEVDEDDQSTLKLSDFVSDTTSNPEDLVYSFDEVNSIALSLNKDVLTIKPAENFFGTRTANVTVTDEGGLSDQTSFNIIVNAVNDAPVLADLPDQTLQPNASVVLDLSSYLSDIDDDNDAISWSFSNEKRTTLSFNDNTDELTISAIPDSSGFDYILVRVTDEANDSDEKTLVVRVVGSGTSAPQISTFPTLEFNEDATSQLNLNNYVTDADDPVQNLFWHNGTGEKIAVEIDHVTNIATFVPEENWNGSEDVWLFVTDPDQNMDSAQVSVTVVPLNDRPQLADLPAMNLSVQLERQINLKSYTTDIDDALNDLTWTNSEGTNVSVQISSAGVATFTASDTWLGQEKITIFVTDKSGAKDTSQVTVFRQDQENAPVITDLSSVDMDEDDEYVINLEEHASDADNTFEELTWKATNNININVVIDTSSNEMTLTPDANWFGTEAIYLELRDPSNNVDFDTMLVTVAAVNDAPSLASFGPISMTENTVYTVDLEDIISDADGLDDIVDISVLSQNSSFIGLFIDLAYFQITFFAPSGFYGDELFLLNVEDTFGATDQLGFKVSVQQYSVKGSIIVSDFGSPTNKNVQYKTSDPTTDYIQYGLTPAYGDSTDMEASPKTEHSLILSNLEENSTYYFRVVSRSSIGAISYSAGSEFSTSSGRDINVFPIPYRASKDVQESGISFTNLPTNSQVKIYNLLGEPVFKKSGLSGYYPWKVENNAGKKISSGLYIYVVNDEKNKKVSSGKIIIVR